MARRANVNTWAANIETAREQLAVAETAHAATLAELNKKGALLAMFAGKKLHDLEIWDCGRKKQ